MTGMRITQIQRKESSVHVLDTAFPIKWRLDTINF